MALRPGLGPHSNSHGLRLPLETYLKPVSLREMLLLGDESLSSFLCEAHEAQLVTETARRQERSGEDKHQHGNGMDPGISLLVTLFKLVFR